MNALYLLNSRDFEAVERRLTLNKTKNLCIVLFYSTQCEYCGPARTAFNFVASQYMRSDIKFGIINITQNPSVPQLSKSTGTPIEYVPLLVAFYGGAPISIFSSKYTPQNLNSFVQNCHASLKTTFGAKNPAAAAAPEPPEEEIPKYTTGVPYCTEGVCYLDFDAAYAAGAVKK